MSPLTGISSRWTEKEVCRQRAERNGIAGSTPTDLFKAFIALDSAQIQKHLVAGADRKVKISFQDWAGEVFSRTVLEMAQDELGCVTWGSPVEKKLRAIVDLLKT